MKYRTIFRWKYNLVTAIRAKCTFLELLGAYHSAFIMNASKEKSAALVDGTSVGEIDPLFIESIEDSFIKEEASPDQGSAFDEDAPSSDDADHISFEQTLLQMQQEYAYERFRRLAGMEKRVPFQNQEKAWQNQKLFADLVWELHSEYRRKLNRIEEQGGVSKRHYRRLLNTKLRLPPRLIGKQRGHGKSPQAAPVRTPEAVVEQLKQMKPIKHRYLERIPYKLFISLVALAATFALGLRFVTEAWRGSIFDLRPVDEKHGELDMTLAEPYSEFVIYEPGWLPEGFVLVKEQVMLASSHHEYVSENEYIVMDQRLSNDRTIVDTEDIIGTEVFVGSQKVIVSVKNKEMRLTWQFDNVRLSLKTNIPQEDALKIIMKLKRSVDK